MLSTSALINQLTDRVLLFDGGMGTCIQPLDLTLDDFDGQEGCNEILIATRPDVIQKIHADYFAAGADIVETNSFGATSIVLAEYDIADRAYELNRKAASLAKQAALDFSTLDRPRFVAGSIGPTTKLPSLGHISYWDLKEAYLSQIQGLVDGDERHGGVDLLLIETCQDLLQTKAALAAVNQIKRSTGKNIPVAVQVTIETTGTMLVGTEMSAVIAAMAPYDIDILGMNCATGPQEMASHIRTLAQQSPFLISCLPNAGIPENVGGHAHYHLTPEQLANHLAVFVQEHGVSLVGGCCGTTPAHIKAVRERLDSLEPFPTLTRSTKDPASLSAAPSPIKGEGSNVAPLSPEWERVAREGRVRGELTSLYSATSLRITPGPVLVGERTNANGSKLFRDKLAENDFDALVDIAKEQVKGGAHLLDVCTAYVSRDEVADMRALLTRLNSQVDVPLMIDSTEVPVIRESLSLLAGKAIVNSINLEDGEERLNTVVSLCREFGAAVVALTIDEDGMAKTAEKKLAIAQRIYDLVVHKHGMKPEDLVFDPLTFTLGSGDAEFRRAGIETLEAIRLIKAAMPGVGTILGISNISFGLKPAARHVINSVFLHEAVEAGLDLAIINSAHLLPLNRISPEERALCMGLIYDGSVSPPPMGEGAPLGAGEGGQQANTFPIIPLPAFGHPLPTGEGNKPDPLMALMAYYEENSASTSGKSVATTLPEKLEERLQYRIVNGEKTGLDADLTEALTRYTALEIINTLLLEGMKTVGELFGKGEMQLPFVLQAAEVMKTAVAFLEPYMEKLEDGQSNAKGTLVLATVKGDVHDIGKNLVDIILTNNGYTVYNLGIKQPIEAILDSALLHHVDAIGMSGLLVKSTAIMKDNLHLMRDRGLKTPVFLGGAALTRRFVEEDCQPIYEGVVRYCKDAFDSLHFMDEVVSSELRSSSSRGDVSPLDSSPLREEMPQTFSRPSEDPEEAYQAVGEIFPSPPPNGVPSPSGGGNIKVDTRRSEFVTANVPVPTPPFWGTKVVDDLPLDTLFPYINQQALFAGQWQIKRGNLSPEAHQKIITETIEPIYARLKQQVLAEKLLVPKVVYGYLPCAADGNDLVVYYPHSPYYPHPQSPSPDTLTRPSLRVKVEGRADEGFISPTSILTSPLVGEVAHPSEADERVRGERLTEWLRFSFPRGGKNRLCIADFFTDSETVQKTRQPDTLGLQLVTVGHRATEYAQSLYEAGNYTEYLYFHGMAVETTEALAEYWHQQMRRHLGIDAADAPEMKRLFAQGYQGSRYSFGYPACPNLEDQAKLFELLDPGRIEVSLSDEFMLVPEQSTSALIVHHPDARYFDVR